ncbi:MAG: hypothetical protein LBR79_06070 [Oscillospiraceae bacterium]|nr:hypothetical protein [Oscillospiraceae bacterium]
MLITLYYNSKLINILLSNCQRNKGIAVFLEKRHVSKPSPRWPGGERRNFNYFDTQPRF